MSINLDPGKSSLFNELNKEKISLRQLLASIIELLIFNCCLNVMFSKKRWWEGELVVCLLSKRDLIVWLDNRADVLS